MATTDKEGKYEYTAFLSYKRRYPDEIIAQDLQTELEHFVIPRKTRKEFGRNSLGKIQLDKKDLPSGKKLTEAIKENLRKSEYLVVLCSENSKESQYVNEEIKYFLEIHDKKTDKIIPVIVYCEEVDVQTVFPEALKSSGIDNRSFANFTEFFVVSEKEKTENRKNKKRQELFRQELVRLAAAMIGCDLDKLVRRIEHMLLRRRLLTILTVFLFTAAVLTLIFSALGNYRENLRSQSVYLSGESASLLADGDRLSAAALAMEALPLEEDPVLEKILRPKIWPARFALSNAIQAYVVPAEGNIAESGSYKATDIITDQLLSPDGRCLVVTDENRVLSVWETEEEKEILREKIKGKGEIALYSYDDRSFLLTSGNILYCYTYKDGNLLWLQKYMDPIDWISTAEEDTLIICLNSGKSSELLWINTTDTEIKARKSLKDAVGRKDTLFQNDSCRTKMKTALLQGESLVLIPCFEEGTGAFLGFITARTAAKDMLFVPVSTLIDEVHGFFPLSDGKIILYGNKDERHLLNCLDVLSGESLWKYESGKNQEETVSSDTETICFQLFSYKGTTALAAADGRTCSILNPDDGSLLNSLVFSGRILQLLEEDKNGLQMLTEEGDLETIKEDGRVTSRKKVFPEHSRVILEFNESKWLMVRDRDTLSYSNEQGDRELTPISLQGSGAIGPDNLTVLDRAIVCIKETEEGQAALLFDPYGKELLGIIQQAELTDGQTVSSVTCLGETENDGTVCFSVMRGSQDYDSILLFHVASREWKEICPADFLGVDKQGIRRFYYHLDKSVLLKDALYFYLTDYGMEPAHSYLACLDINSGELFMQDIPVDNLDTSLAPVLDWKGEKLAYVTKTGIISLQSLNRWSIANPAALQSVLIADDLVFCPFAFSQKENRVVSVSGSGGDYFLEIHDYEGVLLEETDCRLEVPISLYYADNGLFVLFESGSLYCFRDGERSLMAEGISLKDPAVIRWEEWPDGSLCLFTGSEFIRVDVSSEAVAERIQNCFGISSRQNKAYVYRKEEDGTFSFGYYSFYTPEDLIRKGREYLKDYSLTESQKAQYGLK